MIIVYSRAFKKIFKKQSVLVQNKFEDRVSLFAKNIYHPLLGNHALNGEWAQCRSINITGDIRAVYKERDGGIVQFVAIGTHSELYS